MTFGSPDKKIISRYIACTGIFFSVLLVSCSEPSIVGMDVQPKNDLLQASFSDTLSLVTYSVREDSVPTDETLLNLLGSYRDPVFGRTTASFYSQFLLSSENVNFGNTPKYDSIVLSLTFKGYYGDTSAIQNVRVYELKESISKLSRYYSTNTFNASPQLGALSFLPRPSDSVTVGGRMEAPQVRIRLDDALGIRLLAQSGTDQLINNANFLEYFKGIYVFADDVNIPGQGAIMYFDMLSSSSRITLYYNDSLHFDFVCNQNNARINHFTHDYSGTPPLEQFAGTASDTNLVYLQSMAGSRARILMPFLKNFASSGAVAVHKAELLITVDSAATGSYAPIPRLALTKTDAAATAVQFLDDEFEGDSYFGGTYDAASRTYKFNVGKYIQEVLNGSLPDYGLYLLPSGSATGAGRSVICGGRNPLHRMKLNLVYTKL